MSRIVLKQIGIIHSPFRESKGTPIQPSSGKGIEGTVEVFREYEEGLKDLDGFSHLLLVYHFHKVKKSELKVIPFLDHEAHGVFSTRAPVRPNPVGISVVRLLSVEGNRIKIKDMDIMDGTPLLDIKPYLPEVDPGEDMRLGWLDSNFGRFSSSRDDGRFVQ